MNKIHVGMICFFPAVADQGEGGFVAKQEEQVAEFTPLPADFFSVLWVQPYTIQSHVWLPAGLQHAL